MTDRTEAQNLLADIHLLNKIINDAMYDALRYEETGYPHNKQDAFEDLEDVAGFIESMKDSYDMKE